MVVCSHIALGNCHAGAHASDEQAVLVAHRERLSGPSHALAHAVIDEVLRIVGVVVGLGPPKTHRRAPLRGDRARGAHELVDLRFREGLEGDDGKRLHDANYRF